MRMIAKKDKFVPKMDFVVSKNDIRLHVNLIGELDLASNKSIRNGSTFLFRKRPYDRPSSDCGSGKDGKQTIFWCSRIIRMVDYSVSKYF